MARVIKQTFHEDPVFGTVGITRVRFQGSLTGFETITVPPLISVNGAKVVNVNSTTGVSTGNAILADSITLTGALTADDKVTIAGVVYTAKAAPAAAYEFAATVADAGVTDSANLILAINGAVYPAKVGTGTPAHPLVWAIQGSTNKKITLVAKAGGIEGNAITVVETTDTGNKLTITSPLAAGTGKTITAMLQPATTGTLVLFGGIDGDVCDVITYHGTTQLVNTSASA